jgi:hypothetical protein
MKKHGKDGGFSIGGAKIEPSCTGDRCVLNKLDIVEVSWTPTPANQDATCTYVSKAEEEEEDESPQGEPVEDLVEKPCPYKKKAMGLLDKYWDVKDPTPSQSNKPKLGPDREILELDEEEDEEVEKESRTSISESHTHYECDDCGNIWHAPDPGPGPEEYVDISDVSCPECQSDRVWEVSQSRYMATEKTRSAWSFQMAKFKITQKFKSALSRARRNTNPEEG